VALAPCQREKNLKLRKLQKMIEKLTLKNFRNFEHSEFFFSVGKNIII
jgi:recombinational DNA repair ATPase RecF